MKTNIQNGTNILALRDELNRIFYPHSNHFYIDNTTANLTLEKAFKYSIDQYTPLVLETDTSKLPGYSGYVSSKHFVVGYKYNYYLSDDEYITEVSYWDPFNNGRGSYGSHTLTVSQMNHAMTTNDGHYLMRAE